MAKQLEDYMQWPEIEALMYAECGRPETVLGPKQVDKSHVLITAFEPEADSIVVSGEDLKDLSSDWDVEFRHSRENTVQNTHFDKLKDLKDTDYVNFCGTIVYRKKVNVSSPVGMVLNLGLVHGVSEVFVNGQSCGVKWYGRRIHPVSARLKQGENSVEVHVVTVMGNYMKTLKDNKIAQAWTRRQDVVQPAGLVGPVTAYRIKN